MVTFFDLPTQESGAALCKLLPAALRIVEDPAIADALTSFKEETTVPYPLFMLQICSKVAPVLLQTHFDDTITVISAFTGKTEDAIKAQTGKETLKDISDCLHMDVLDFFTPSAPED